MDFIEIVELLKAHWAAVLESGKERINREGALSATAVQNLRKMLDDVKAMIADGVDNELELIDLEWQEDDLARARQELDKIMKSGNVSFPEGSPE